MSGSDAARKIAHQLKQHRRWLEETADSVRDRELGYLAEDLQNPDFEAFRGMTDSLSMLATCTAVSGIVSVVDGNVAGWSDVLSALDFHGWALRLRCETWFRSGHLGVVADPLPLTPALSRLAAMACMPHQCAPESVDWLRRAVASELAIDAEYLQESVFEPFVLGCIDRAQGSGLVVSGFKGVYSDVLQAWDDDARLAKALLNVCDYHCSNISDNRRGRYAEFTKPPFDLLPCELMLVNRLRKDTGRAPLEFSHPLTDTLGPIPGDASPQSHPVLGELRAAWERFWS